MSRMAPLLVLRTATPHEARAVVNRSKRHPRWLHWVPRVISPRC